LGFFGGACRRLTDNLDSMDQRESKHSILLEGRMGLPCHKSDRVLGGVTQVAQACSVIRLEQTAPRMIRMPKIDVDAGWILRTARPTC
jgi:hypothetical protein